MQTTLKNTLVRLLKETAERIDAGNCEMSNAEAIDLINTIGHISMSKEEVCRYVNTSRSNFDRLVLEGKFPKGRKVLGRKELVWYKDEIDKCLPYK